MRRTLQKIFYSFILVFSVFNKSVGQTTIYTEDFSTNTGKGQTGASLDTVGVSNWTLDMDGSVTMSGTDRFNVTGGRFESFNTDAPSTNPVDWFTTIQCISGYSSVDLAVDLGRVSSNSESGVQAFYRIHDGTNWSSWTSIGSLIGSGTPNPSTVTSTGLTGDSIQMRVAHWGTSATPTYYHDNVIMVATGSSTCGGPPCVPDSATIITTSEMGMCVGAERTLSGTPIGGTWSVLSGPGLIVGTTVTSTGIGEIKVVYTAGNCNLQDTISIQSYEIPTATIVSPSSDLCENHTRTLVGSPAGGTFSIVSGPATLSGDVLTPSGVGTVNISYQYSNGICDTATTQSFSIISGCPENVYVGPWDALNFFSAAPCTWIPQDQNFLGSIDYPFASLQAGAEATDNTPNSTLVFLPDAYVGSYDYDEDGNNESCTGSQIAYVYNLTSLDNGLRILGVDGGCGTLLDLSEGGSITTNFALVNGVNGLSIKDLYFKSWGGALQLNNSTNILIENCVFDDCDNGEAAITIDSSINVTFKNCTFINSKITSGFKQVEILGSSNNITFSDCLWSCNQDPGNEGGAVLIECEGIVNFDDCIFSGNRSNGTSGDGGAMTIQNNPTVNFNGGSFSNNRSESTTGTFGGGAINIKGGKVTIDGTHFFGNKAAANGGAILFSEDTHPLIIKNAIFEADTAGGNGGAIYIANTTTVEIYNSYFLENSATNGGAIYVNAGTEGSSQSGVATEVYIASTSIYNNTSTGNTAGGIHFEDSDNNIDSDNVPNSDSFNIENSKVWGNASSGTFKDITERYYWCSFCSGSDVDPAILIDATSIIGSGNAISFGWGVENVSLTQGDTSLYNVGWNGSFTEAEGTDIDCLVGYCALTIPGSCFAANYSETSVSICVNPFATSSISGQVWIDADEDGIKAISEIGHSDVERVVVILLNEDNYQIGFTLTDVNGNYNFSNLPEGNYTINIQNPDIDTYFSLTTKNQIGSTDSTDSDADLIINDTILSGFYLIGGFITTSLSNNEHKVHLDAGFFEGRGEISGFVFKDTILDGLFINEPLLENAQVVLFSCGLNDICGDEDDIFVDAAVTSSAGEYLFENLTLNNQYYLIFYDSIIGETSNYFRTIQLNPNNFAASTIDSDVFVETGRTPDISLFNSLKNIAYVNQGLSLTRQSLLPIELVSYQYNINESCDVEIQWTTAVEINNHYFKLMKSYDAIHFYELSRIEGKGNTTELTHYSFIDQSNDRQTAFYKLVQVDFDGTEEHFNTLSYDGNCSLLQTKIEIGPNPFNDFITIYLNNTQSGNTYVDLINIKGQIIEKLHIDSTNQNVRKTLSTQNLESGFYILNIYSQNNPIGSYKIIKL